MPNMPPMTRLRRFAFTLLCLTAASGTLLCGTSAARESAPGRTADLSATELPSQGREVLARIREGGPFAFPKKDGTTFSNREKRLPALPRGAYKEYTVPTPGSRDRGARRIVCSGNIRSTKDSICYYTDDHYASFRRIRE